MNEVIAELDARIQDNPGFFSGDLPSLLVRHLTKSSVIRRSSPPPVKRANKPCLEVIANVIGTLEFSLQHSTTPKGLEAIQASGDVLLAGRYQTQPTDGMTANVASHKNLKEEGLYVFAYLTPTIYGKARIPDYQSSSMYNHPVIILPSDLAFDACPEAVVRVYCNSFLLNSSVVPAVRIGNLCFQVQFQCQANPLDAIILHTLSDAEGEIVWEYREKARDAQCSVKEFRQHLCNRLLRVLEAAISLDPGLESTLLAGATGKNPEKYVATLLRDLLGPVECLFPKRLALGAEAEILACNHAVYRQYQEDTRKMLKGIAANNTSAYRENFRKILTCLKVNPSLLHGSVTELGDVTAFDIVAALLNLSACKDQVCLNILKYLFQQIGDSTFNINQVLMQFSEQNIGGYLPEEGRTIAINKALAEVNVSRFSTNYLLLALEKGKFKVAEWLLSLGANPYAHCIFRYVSTGRIDRMAFDKAPPGLLKGWPKPKKPVVSSPLIALGVSTSLKEISLLAKLLTEEGMQVSFDGVHVRFTCKVMQTSQRYAYVNSTLLLTIPQALGANIPYVDTRKFVAEEYGLDSYCVKLGADTKHAPPFCQHDVFESLEAVRDRLLTRYVTRLLITAQNQAYFQKTGERHPHTGKGAGSAKVLLHPKPLTGFGISVFVREGLFVVKVTDHNTQRHLELVLAYLHYMLPDYAENIQISEGEMHVKGVDLSVLLQAQLDQQINYMGIVHENPSGEIAVACSVRKVVVQNENGEPVLHAIPKGYATAGGYNLEPGHPFPVLQVAKDSKTEFDIDINPRDVGRIDSEKVPGQALFQAFVPGDTVVTPEAAEFDWDSGRFALISLMVLDEVLLRDLPTFDILWRYRAALFQQYFQAALSEEVHKVTARVNVDSTQNVLLGMRTLSQDYGSVVIECRLKKQVPANFLENLAKGLEGSVLDAENSTITMPLACAEAFWLRVKERLDLPPFQDVKLTLPDVDLASEVSQQVPSSLIQNPKEVNAKLFSDYLISVFPSEASKVEFTLERLTSAAFVQFSEVFLRRMSPNAGLLILRNTTLHEKCAAFYLNEVIPEARRLEHFDCLPAFLRESLSQLITVSVMDLVIAQQPISVKTFRFLMNLPIQRSVCVAGKHASLQQIFQQHSRKDLLGVLNSPEIEAQLSSQKSVGLCP